MTSNIYDRLMNQLGDETQAFDGSQSRLLLFESDGRRGELILQVPTPWAVSVLPKALLTLELY